MMEEGTVVLILGYGNTLRGDDGLGPYIVERIACRGLPGVKTRTVLQLTPELTEELARVPEAIVVDACVGAADSVNVREAKAREAADEFTHVADVEALLGLTARLFARVPHTWIVSVAGTDFSFHEGLSPQAQKNADRAIRTIEGLVQKTTTEAQRRPREVTADGE